MAEELTIAQNLTLEEKRALLAKLLQKKNQQPAYAPLSFTQQRLWFLDQLLEGTPNYNIPTCVRLEGPFQPAALQNGLEEMIRRHESLRTTFPIIDDQPQQAIVPAHPYHLPVLSVMDHQDPEAEARRQIQEQANQVFDLEQGPLWKAILYRLDDEDYVLLLVMHHIITDGWSVGIFVRELVTLYTMYVQGLTPELPSLPVQYADFARWQQDWFNSSAQKTQMRYWKEALADFDGILPLPIDYPRPSVQSARGKSHYLPLGPEVAQQLSKFCKNTRSTPFMVLIAAYFGLLAQVTGENDIAVGTPVANRTRSELEGLIGFFANTIVLRMKLEDNPTFRALLQRVKKNAVDSFSHQDMPFEKLVEELQPARDLSHSPIFQTMFVLQNASNGEVSLPNLEVKPFPIEISTAKFDLLLSLNIADGDIYTAWEYNRDLFAPDTIERMAGRFKRLLQQFLSDADQPIRPVILSDRRERQRLLVEWNKTDRSFPSSPSWAAAFEAQAERSPERPAAVYGHHSLTYQELNGRANQLARHLRSLGVERHALVGLYVERSLDMMVGLLGILKAGGAYVPLDPSWPEERIRTICDEAALSAVVTQQALLDRSGFPTESGVEPVCLDTNRPLIESYEPNNLEIDGADHDLAYVIFTSGSTGRPKGVMVEQSGVLNLTHALKKAIYDRLPVERPLQVSVNGPLVFDTSVKQLVQLLSGHTLDITPPGVRMDGESLLGYLIEQKIEVFDCTPSQLTLLLGAGLLQRETSLKAVLIGGEALTQTMWQTLAESSHIKFFNVYGPTECTVDATVALIEPGQLPHIGRPLGNVRVYVLDSRAQPVPIGVPGELYIGGAGVARGYLNRDRLTRERFIADPFRPLEKGRLYKTGDQVRYLADGRLLFMGRLDKQIKLRGYRIELGEIEAALRQHPGVRESIAIVHEASTADLPDGGDQQLLAYFVPHEEAPTSGELRQFLAGRLPEYMLPFAFIRLEAVPLTTNGKLDTRALPRPEAEDLALSAPYAAPQTAEEQLMAEMWADLLEVPRVGVGDNFFELGGHSLLAARLMVRIRQQFEVDLPLVTIFQSPTIRELVRLINHGGTGDSNLAAVPIRTGGSEPPFFCVHPIGGHVFCYVELANRLSDSRPFYGLQARGLDGRQPPLDSIPEMAAYYIESMQSVQPAGPYFLGGWSLGGMIAYEMAQQLQRSGHEVELLALFDTYIPKRLRRFRRVSDLDMLLMLIREFASAAGEEATTDMVNLKEIKKLRGEAQLAALLEQAQAAGLMPQEMSLPQLQSYLAVYESNRRAYYAYKPAAYSASGRVILFEAGEGQNKRLASDGWSKLVPYRLDIRPVVDDHYGLMKGDTVQGVAAQLDRYLEGQREKLR